MPEFRHDYDDQIDLIDVILTLWDGKWKILSISFLFLLGAIGYNVYSPQINLTTTTVIKPINSVQYDSFRPLNDIGFFEIDPIKIVELYVEHLEDGLIFEQAIKKYKLLDPKKYGDELSYESDVIDLAYSIDIIPIKFDRNDGRPSYWEIQFSFNDIEKWKQALFYIDQLTTESVRQSLISLFNNAASKAKQRMEYEIEDLSTKIQNAKDDYHRSTANKLAFLKEQKEIAIALDMKLGTLEAQTFDEETFISYVEKDTPYYYRGYESINKEIELIKSRDRIEAFVPELIELESQKRGYEQDRQFSRAESRFASSPIANAINFKASTISIEASRIDIESKYRLLLIIAFSTGVGIGSIYVIVMNAIRKRKMQLLEE